MTFVILEDDADRLSRFSSALCEIGFSGELAHFARADDCIDWLSHNLPSVIGLSLDHDLIDERPEATDPGDGRQVADWLAEQAARIPVIVHSSNAERARGMFFCLQDASFPVRRVVPIGDDWIETDWKIAVTEDIVTKIGRTAKRSNGENTANS